MPRNTVYRYYANIYRPTQFVTPGLKSARFLERTFGPEKFELDEEYQQLAIAHKLFDQLSNDEGYFVSIYDETRGLVFLYTYKRGVGVHFAAPSPVRNIRSLEEFESMAWYTEGENRYVFRFGGDLEPYNSPAYKQTPERTPKMYFGAIVPPKPANVIVQPPEMLIRASQTPVVTKTSAPVPGSVPKIYLRESGSGDRILMPSPANQIAQSAEVLNRASNKTQQPTPRRGLFSWLF
jgi:hypothetical protein